MRIRRRIYTIMMAALMLALLLAACQPTPSEQVIVNKGDGDLENIIQETSNNSVSIDASESWKETVKSQVMDAVISIDAKVEIPQNKTYSVYKIKPVPFTEKQVTNMCEVFFGGREMFLLNNEMTKEDYSNKILEQKAYLLEMQNHKESMSENEIEEETNRVNDLIDQYTIEYQSAPDTVNRTKINEVKFSDEGICNGINIMSKTDDGEWDYLNVGNVENNLNNDLCYYIDSLDHDPKSKIFEGDCIDELSLTLKDAEILANGLMEKLGLQNSFTIYAVYTEGMKKSETYMIRYARIVDGVSAALIDQNYGQSAAVYADGKIPEKEEYRELWPNEYIEIDIKENGLKRFIWQSPGEIVNTINEDVTMLPFDEVQNIFRNQISILDFKTGRYKVIAINISNVTLNLMRVPIQDNPDEYYLLPVWDFFGDVTLDNGTAQVDSDSFLTINAVDGSIINRSVGY